MRIPTRLLSAFAIAPLLLWSGAGAAQSGMSVVVNGEALSIEEVLALQQAYGQVLPGYYWYDPHSGLWGQEGGPSIGQIAPGLPLGGPMSPDASNGQTGVFINGRELPMQDLFNLQQLVGEVPRERYWLDAQGNIGLEGGPALLNLWAVSQQSGYAGAGGGGGSGGGGSYRNSAVGIGVTTDGEGGVFISDW